MENINDIVLYLKENMTIFALRLVGAVAIYIVGRWLAKVLSRSLEKFLNSKEIDPTLSNFLEKIVYFVILIITILAALTQLGIETTSFLAVLGAAGLAVGLALQGSLSNFAAGILLIVLRPFRVGDAVQIAGATGSVEEINILTTRLVTPQNQLVVIPNSRITSDNIVNITTRGTRRMDLVFGIGYDDDIKKAKQILQEIVDNDSRILKDPAPLIVLGELGDSSVNLYCRPWAKNEDYWKLYFDIHETVKQRFDAEGISIPFPQRDVHLYQT